MSAIVADMRRAASFVSTRASTASTALTEAEAAQYSPIRFVSPGAAPSLIVHGDADTVVPMLEAETMHAALAKAGVAASFIHIEGAGHGFEGADFARAAGERQNASRLLRQKQTTWPDMDLPSYIEARLRTELPQLADHLREWVEAHRSELREAGVWSDPEGTQPVRVWLVTCHTGSNDASARIVYDTMSDGFGLVTDLANGIEWYMGPYGSLVDTIASL